MIVRAFFICCKDEIQRKGNKAISKQNAVGIQNPSELKAFIEQSLDADKAEDIITIDLDDQSALADYMIIASGTSSRHVDSLAKNLKKKLELSGVKNIKIEGMSQSDWVAIDTGDVIIHLFRPEVREFYNIEKMWCTYQPFQIVESANQASA